MSRCFDFDSIPAKAGIGLKPIHFETILSTQPEIGWFEIHPENYLCEGGILHHYLTRVRELYPLSLHSVGLSLGSAEGPSNERLNSLKILIERYQPGLVSEHLSWSFNDNTFLNDLLPLPYTEDTLQIITRNIKKAQDVLGQQILIENPSTYTAFRASEIDECDFLAELAKRTDCLILLDVNNVYVNSQNHGIDSISFIDAIPQDKVGEIHLAGHSRETIGERTLCIDDHGSEIIEPVWQLYEHAIERFGQQPSLIEWDNNVPDFEVLLAQAKHAELMLSGAYV